ncbi:MAG: hypothetical protein ABW199_06720 [Caulobacterales bacterium]
MTATNIIPFPRQPAREPVSFSLGVRYDLRVGAPASGVVRPLGEDATSYSGLARVLRAARMTWRTRSACGQLTLVVPEGIHQTMDAETLDAAVIEAGCARRTLTFEFLESEIVSYGPELAIALRARGWGVALNGDPDCPLPFGSKARGLYTELVLDAPDMTNPFLGLDPRDRSPIGRRLLAAKEAGMAITAEHVRSQAQARLLAMAGFDRGSGAFADPLRA